MVDHDRTQDSVRIQWRNSVLQGGFVGLRIDSHRVQSAMAQQGGCCWKVHRVNEPPCRVVAEAMGMNVGHIGTPAEHGQEIADPAIAVRATLASENWSFGDRGPNGTQDLAHRGIQGDHTGLVALRARSRGSGMGPCHSERPMGRRPRGRP